MLDLDVRGHPDDTDPVVANRIDRPGHVRAVPTAVAPGGPVAGIRRIGIAPRAVVGRGDIVDHVVAGHRLVDEIRVRGGPGVQDSDDDLGSPSRQAPRRRSLHPVGAVEAPHLAARVVGVIRLELRTWGRRDARCGRARADGVGGAHTRVVGDGVGQAREGAGERGRRGGAGVQRAASRGCGVQLRGVARERTASVTGRRGPGEADLLRGGPPLE